MRDVSCIHYIIFDLTGDADAANFGPHVGASFELGEELGQGRREIFDVL